MYCNQCGTRLDDQATVCGVCGKPTGLAAASAAPPRPAIDPAGGVSLSAQRIETHRTVLGVLWILWGLLGIVPSLFLLGFSHFALPWMGAGMPPHMMHLWPVMSGFMGVIGGLMLALTVAHLAAGIGILQRQSWARMLALIVAFLALIHVPFGTVLGIYTIWVFVSADAGRAWEQASVS